MYSLSLSLCIIYVYVVSSRIVLLYAVQNIMVLRVLWDYLSMLYSFVNNNNNNILYSSQREIKAVVRSHDEEHISIILNHETHAHTHS